MYKELQLVAGKQRNLLCSLKILPFHCDKAVSLGGGQQHPFFSHQIPWDVARRWIWTDAIVHKPLWNSRTLLARRLRWRAWLPGWWTEMRVQHRVWIGTTLSDVGSWWVWWWNEMVKTRRGALTDLQCYILNALLLDFHICNLQLDAKLCAYSIRSHSKGLEKSCKRVLMKTLVCIVLCIYIYIYA